MRFTVLVTVDTPDVPYAAALREVADHLDDLEDLLPHVHGTLYRFSTPEMQGYFTLIPDTHEPDPEAPLGSAGGGRV